MKYNTKIISTPTCVSAIWNHPENFLARGVVSADIIDIENRTWWINRAIINPEEYRGRGIGSLLLQGLIETIIKQEGLMIYVIPGGYNQDIDKQYNFYQKNGFIIHAIDQDKGLIYPIKR